MGKVRQALKTLQEAPSLKGKRMWKSNLCATNLRPQTVCVCVWGGLWFGGRRQLLLVYGTPSIPKNQPSYSESSLEMPLSAMHCGKFTDAAKEDYGRFSCHTLFPPQKAHGRLV